MAFCPLCAAEFPRGSRCPDHGALVEVLHSDNLDGSTPDRFVKLLTVWSETMAQSWSQMLRNNAIPTLVKAGGPGFSLGMPPPVGYESYVYVPQSLLQRSRSILEDFEEQGVLRLENAAGLGDE